MTLAVSHLVADRGFDRQRFVRFVALSSDLHADSPEQERQRAGVRDLRIAPDLEGVSQFMADQGHEVASRALRLKVDDHVANGPDAADELAARRCARRRIS